MGEGVLLLLLPGVTSFDMPCCHTVADARTQPCFAQHLLFRSGTFGRVLECWDRKNKDYCAVKIVRNVKKYRDAAMIEVRHFWEQLHPKHPFS